MFCFVVVVVVVVLCRVQWPSSIICWYSLLPLPSSSDSCLLIYLLSFVGFLVGWLVGWLVVWLVGWLVGWSSYDCCMLTYSDVDVIVNRLPKNLGVSHGFRVVVRVPMFAKFLS